LERALVDIRMKERKQFGNRKNSINMKRRTP
jgi:hypothetical protein